jgi:hypothetical protein
MLCNKCQDLFEGPLEVESGVADPIPFTPRFKHRNVDAWSLDKLSDPEGECFICHRMYHTIVWKFPHELEGTSDLPLYIHRVARVSFPDSRNPEPIPRHAYGGFIAISLKDHPGSDYGDNDIVKYLQLELTLIDSPKPLCNTLSLDCGEPNLTLL